MNELEASFKLAGACGAIYFAVVNYITADFSRKGADRTVRPCNFKHLYTWVSRELVHPCHLHIF